MALTPDNAMEQAHEQAHEYLARAARTVDDVFGEGYAIKNPDLVAVVAKLAADDFRLTANLGQMTLL